jgi:hypothetical protein
MQPDYSIRGRVMDEQMEPMQSHSGNLDGAHVDLDDASMDLAWNKNQNVALRSHGCR